MTRIKALAAALVLAAPLSACGPVAEQQSAPAVGTNRPATNAPTPSATQVATPEVWEVRSKNGAKAFARPWVAAINQAQSGRFDELVALNEGCTVCDDFLDQYQTVYEAGGTIKSAPYRLLSATVQHGGRPDRRTVLVVFESGKVTWIRSPGAKPESYRGGASAQLLEVTWSDGQWKTTKLVPLPEVPE